MFASAVCSIVVFLVECRINVDFSFSAVGNSLFTGFAYCCADGSARQ